MDRSVSRVGDTAAAEQQRLRTNTDAQLQRVSNSWNQALSLYAQGLRDHDSREVLQAFDIMRDAERYNFESEALLQRLEAQR